jgi:hypothetical protein
MRSAAGQRMLFDDLATCGRCGRFLANEESIRRGYGLACWLMMVRANLFRRWKRRLRLKLKRNHTPKKTYQKGKAKHVHAATEFGYLKRPRLREAGGGV